MAAALAIKFEECLLETMAEGIKETLLNAFRQLLRPLVRILLKHGVSYGEYESTAKTVFVEVAQRDFALPNQTQSSERVATVTGLSIDEVDRVNRLIEAKSQPSNQNLNRIGGLLGGWHQDPAFTGPYGLPLELEFLSPRNSFTELVTRYGDGVPAMEMLDELKRIGVVTELPGGRIRVLSRSYIPQQFDSAAFQFMGVALRDLAETLSANVDGNEDEGYFERRVWTPNGIDIRDMPAFDVLVNQKGMEFLETLDNWLSGKESDAEKIPASEKIKVGVGVYLFSDAKRSFKDE